MLNIIAFAQQENISANIQNKSFDPSALLWYNAPAKIWNDALPVGNGRLGAMIIGDPENERIQLNEDTYWSGGPYSSMVKGGAKYLPELRQLVFKGEWWKAQKLFGRKFMGDPVEQQKYQPLANLMLFFSHGQKYTNYKRWLNLETGITSVQYMVDGVTYHRDVFASVPYQVVVVRLKADKPGSISFTANLRGNTSYSTDYFRMDGVGNNE